MKKNIDIPLSFYSLNREGGERQALKITTANYKTITTIKKNQ